jgi:hypothetical protein
VRCTGIVEALERHPVRMDKETVTETVTLAEAAKMLQTNLPRLTRLIERPHSADSVRREPRQTKTGIRTVTLLSVSVLPALKADLQGKVETEREQKQKQSQEELLASVQSEVAFLRAELVAQREARDKADSEFRRLLLSRDMEITRIQQENRLLLAAPPVENATQDAQETRTDTETPDMVNHTLGAETGIQSAQEKKKWWQRLFGKR